MITVKQKIAAFSLTIMFCLTVFANDLSGKYSCNGFDRQDKSIKNTTLIVSLDKENSILKNNYSAYHVQWAAPSAFKVKGLPSHVAATGAIAANGNTLALMFKNTNPKAPTDYGVLIGKAIHNKDASGNNQIILHFFGYQPVYKNGDNSTWVCELDTRKQNK